MLRAMNAAMTSTMPQRIARMAIQMTMDSTPTPRTGHEQDPDQQGQGRSDGSIHRGRVRVLEKAPNAWKIAPMMNQTPRIQVRTTATSNGWTTASRPARIETAPKTMSQPLPRASGLNAPAM